jgi:hypothetical protein
VNVSSKRLLTADNRHGCQLRPVDAGRADHGEGRLTVRWPM